MIASIVQQQVKVIDVLQTPTSIKVVTVELPVIPTNINAVYEEAN